MTTSCLESICGPRKTTMVGLTHEEMMHYWGFSNYPDERLEFDLGGRKFVITGTPGHQSSEIAFYDEWTDLLYTGDMFYRGRLYLRTGMLGRLVSSGFARWPTTIRSLTLSITHIEMTKTPMVDYPIGTTCSPTSPPCRCPLRC